MILNRGTISVGTFPVGVVSLAYASAAIHAFFVFEKDVGLARIADMALNCIGTVPMARS